MILYSCFDTGYRHTDERLTIGQKDNKHMHGVHQTGYVHGIVASGRHEVTLGLYSGKRKQIPDELFFRLVLHMELTRDLYMDTGTILKHMIVVMNVSQRERERERKRCSCQNTATSQEDCCGCRIVGEDHGWTLNRDTVEEGT